MEHNQLTIIFDDEEVLADILFTHINEETLKQYVVYEIVGTDEISAARYIQTSSEGGYFEDIETDEEWEELEEVLEQYFDSLPDDEEFEGDEEEHHHHHHHHEGEDHECHHHDEDENDASEE